MTKNFRGIFPALLTPFAADGSVNYAELRKLVRFNLDKGVAGFYVDGSTAESFLLEADERKKILETVADENAGRGTILAHIGCISQKQAIDLAKHAKANGADAVSSVAPFYFNFTWEEIRQYYLSIADAVDLPVLIYNFPGFSGVKLQVEQVLELLQDTRFLGVKHTSSDYYMLERFKNFRSDAIVYNGYDEMFISGIAMGADGGIGSTYNFMAEKFIRMMELCENGKYDEAREIQHQANNILQLLMKVGIMPGEKAALKMMGIDLGVCRKPFRELSQDEENKLRSVLAANGCSLEH